MGTRLLVLVGLISMGWITGGHAQDRGGPPPFPYQLEAPKRVFDLPASLEEASGLAVHGPHSVLVHDDERAVVHVIDTQTGEVTGAFAIGRPPLKGDFEGIAVAPDRVFLILSDGRVLAASFPKGIDRGSRQEDYRIHETGLGSHCETEGIAAFGDGFLIACKEIGRARMGTDDDPGIFEIHRWRPGKRATLYRRFEAAVLDRKRVNLSGLAVLDPSGALILLAARQRLMIRVDSDPHVPPRAVKLKKKAHPQPEGVAVLANGDLVIVDERKDKETPARLSVYGREGTRR